MKRRKSGRKVWMAVRRAVFGPDIFISYAHRDGTPYAQAITDHFLDLGYDCFLDKYLSVGPGPELPASIIFAIADARAFVLIASEKTTDSEPVAKEIRFFLFKNGKKCPFIPIDIGNAINDKAIWYPSVSGAPRLVDTVEQFDAGRPDAEVFIGIEKNLRTQSKQKRFRRGLKIIGLFAAILATISVLMAISLTYTIGERDRIVMEKTGLTRQVDGLRNAKDSVTRLVAAVLGQKNVIQDSMRVEEKELSLQMARGAVLSDQNKVEYERLVAMRYLGRDAQTAFRLADDAHRKYPRESDDEAMRQAISSIGFFYTSVLRGYNAAAMRGDTLLLQKMDERKADYFFFDLVHRKITPVPISDYLFDIRLIPTGDGYNIFAKTGYSDYRLFDQHGRPLSGKVKRLPWDLADVTFINDHLVRFITGDTIRWLTWNLATNEREMKELPKRGGYLSEFPDYNLLATRHDGQSGVICQGKAGDEGLALIDEDGGLVDGSYVPVGGAGALQQASGGWSHDDEFLAVTDHTRQRIGFWQPKKRKMRWVDLGEWLIHGYTWDIGSHRIALEGGLPDEQNTSTMLIDADHPDSVKGLYKGNRRIMSIAFLPDGRELAVENEDGVIQLVDPVSGELGGQGYHYPSGKLYSTATTFCSLGSGEIRFWSPIPAPSTHWAFRSSSSRRYRGAGGADPLSRYLAVPFVSDKKGGCVEVRDMTTGRSFDLPTPDTAGIELRFSPDGSWLAFESYDKLRIWRIDTWEYSDIPLRDGDRQFWGFRFIADTLVARAIQTKNDDDRPENWQEYVYRLLLRGPSAQWMDRARARSRGEFPYVETRTGLRRSILGWPVNEVYQWRNDQMTWEPDNGWIVRRKCRTERGEDACDCDIEFIPSDLKKVSGMYDRLMWKPDRKWVEEMVGRAR